MKFGQVHHRIHHQWKSEQHADTQARINCDAKPLAVGNVSIDHLLNIISKTQVSQNSKTGKHQGQTCDGSIQEPDKVVSISFHARFNWQDLKHIQVVGTAQLDSVQMKSQA